MNIVILIGRLTRDPNSLNNGGVSFTVAIDRPQAQDGTKGTDYPKVVVFGKQAESCKRYLNKGRMVAIQGSLKTGSYQDKDGKTVDTQDVVARRVKFLDYGDQPQAQAQPQPQPQADQYGYAAIDEDVPF